MIRRGTGPGVRGRRFVAPGRLRSSSRWRPARRPDAPRRPSRSLVLRPRLAGDRAPAGLVAEHPAFGIVGPQDATHGLHRGSKPCLARQQFALHPLLVQGRGEDRQEQDEEGRAGDVEREILLALHARHRMGGVGGAFIDGDRRGGHAGVMHAGHGNPHDAGRDKLLPDAVLVKREPQGRGRRGHGDRHRERDYGPIVGKVAGDPKRRHAGVVHAGDPQTHQHARHEDAAEPLPGPLHPQKAGAGGRNGDREGEEGQADVVGGGHAGFEGQHADEMHRPDAAAHGERSAGDPRPAGAAATGPRMRLPRSSAV